MVLASRRIAIWGKSGKSTAESSIACDGTPGANALPAEVLLLHPPLLELTPEASHLLFALSLEDLLFMKAPGIRRIPPVSCLELLALALLEPLLFTPLPHLQIV